MHVGLELSIIPEKYAGRASKAILAFLIASACLVIASVLVRAPRSHKFSEWFRSPGFARSNGGVKPPVPTAPKPETK